MRLSPAIAIIVLLNFSGCRTADPESPALGIEAFGLVESPIDHPTLLSSLKIAQLVLGPAAPTKIVAGWQTPQDASAVRIFAASAQGLADHDLMTSYAQCKCVVAKVGGMSGWLERSVGTGHPLLAVDLHNVLAYMLLHEVGHIVSGDFPGKDEQSGSVTQSKASSLNLDSTLQKDREVAADRYAAQAISTAIAERGTERGVAAAAIALTLSQLSWNLAEHRLLDNFGGTTTRERALFWDSGLSHPNLEWRILSVNDALSNTTASHQLLTDFESSRQSEHSVLYRAPKP